MHLFAVAFADSVESFIEFYWAEDSEHAEEQALDAHPESSGDTWLVSCAMVPDDYVRQPEAVAQS